MSRRRDDEEYEDELEWREQMLKQLTSLKRNFVAFACVILFLIFLYILFVIIWVQASMTAARQFLR